MRNPHCALQPGLSSLLLVHSPLLGGPACCACGLQVQAGRAVSDLRPLSCLMHPLLMQIQLQSGAAWFWQGHLWQCSVADPGWHCALHRVSVALAGGDFPLWTIRMQRGRVAVSAAACSVAKVSQCSQVQQCPAQLTAEELCGCQPSTATVSSADVLSRQE